jgi:hypothetical protein
MPSIRQGGILAAAVLAAALLEGCASFAHVDIDQAELQSRIAARFPTHHCKLLIACVDLSDPVVLLQEGDDHIRFTTAVKVVLGTQERTGRIGLSGRPRYVPDAGQLFLDDVQITTLELSGVPEAYVELVRARGADAARQALQSRPVYTLDGHSAKGALARRAVRDVKVVNGRLRISFTDG